MTTSEVLRRERRAERQLEEALDRMRRDFETPEAMTEYQALAWALEVQRERVARFTADQVKH